MSGVRCRSAEAITAVVVVAAVLGGCSQGETLGRLQHAPEAALRYPGATAVSVVSHTPGPAPENSADHLKAALQVHSEVRATSFDIVSYYADALLARGWHRDDDAPDSAIGYFESEVWRKDGRVFALHLAQGAHGRTVIETTLAYS